MSPNITSDWMVVHRDRVLVNDASYQADIPMAGRTEALDALCTAIATKESCNVISDHLGAGKSFLVKKAIGKLIETKTIDEDRDVAWFFPDELLDGSKIKQTNAPVIIIDDLDRKIESYKIQNSIRQVAQWLETARDKTAILIGDYTVRSIELTRTVANERPLQWVPLEPLDWPLLNTAIAARAAHHLAGVDINDVLPAVTAMFSDDLRYALLPPTEPSVANFRDVFGILQGMAGRLPLSNEPCRFTGESYREWKKRNRIDDEPEEKNKKKRKRIDESERRQLKFVEQLHEIIAERAKRKETWRALGTEEWMDLMSDNSDPCEYLDEVLEPLARAQVLLPMGMPYYLPEQRKFPPPYLPTISTFMAALLGRP